MIAGNLDARVPLRFDARDRKCCGEPIIEFKSTGYMARLIVSNIALYTELFRRLYPNIDIFREPVDNPKAL
jgi:hypothetical protein